MQPKQLFLVILFLLITGQSLALEKEKRYAVDDILDATNARQLSDLLARNFTYSMMQALTEKYGKLDRIIADVVYEEAKVIMYEQYIINGKLNDIFYDLYDEYFTASELRTLAEFYRSSAGRRFLQVNQALSSRSMQMAQEHTETFILDAQERVRLKLKKLVESAEAADTPTAETDQAKE